MKIRRQAMYAHSDVDNFLWWFKKYGLLLHKNVTMGYNTIDEFAEAIVKAGGGQELIKDSLLSIHEQGYNKGYTDCTSDFRKAKQSRRKVATEAFKKVMDTIDDVMRSKWL
jgi:hypothetical protein